MKVALFNGPVLTCNGLFRLSDISPSEARKLIEEHGFVSAIGHRSTARVLSQLLSHNIPMNRIQFHQQVGQMVIVFKLNQRPPEGEILNVEEVIAIGYSLKLLEHLE